VTQLIFELTVKSLITKEVSFATMHSTAMEINSFCSPVIYRCGLSPSSGHVDNTQQRYRADNQARPYIDP
jgi:hypothetical protein